MLLLGFILVPIVFILTAPDGGVVKVAPQYAEILTYLVYLMRIFLVFGLLHIIRKMMLDYNSADFNKLLEKAIEDKQAGLAAIAIALCILGFCILLGAMVIPAAGV